VASTSKPIPRLVCASGVKQSGGHGVRVDITLAVPEAEDAGGIVRDALARRSQLRSSNSPQDSSSTQTSRSTDPYLSH
jgi:hypothetical protein